MAKSQSRYVCQTCGDAFLRWEGQCRSCGSWNSLVETLIRKPSPAERRQAQPSSATPSAVPLAHVGEADATRLPTGIGELDRVLGGGLVPGSLILVGGEPGIGKSTLLLQAAAGLTRAEGARVLYATGEESGAQVRLRAARLGLVDGPAGQSIQVLAASHVAAIVDAADRGAFGAVIVDSIQTATVDDLDGPAGSVGQVRESALQLMDMAKQRDIAVLLVGHVTKDGSIAGPRTLEHLVDAVLSLEGERYATLRLLRATKNRFGSTEEVGVFEMGEPGLSEVTDPGRAFLVEHAEPAPGSVVAATLEGSRPLLVEVQALVAASPFGTPARRASGLDANRLGLLVAVLGKRAGVALGSHDVYANLAGGLSLNEPGLDLPVAVALASSVRDLAVDPGTVVAGEVGLLGELRPIAGLERRLAEAGRLGFRRAIVPEPGRGGKWNRRLPPDLAVVPVRTLRDAVSAAIDRTG